VDVGHQPVADALATVRILDVATLVHVTVDRLGATAPTDRAVGLLVRVTEVAEIAHAPASIVRVGVGHGTRQLEDFEREAGGRCQGVRLHVQYSSSTQLQHLPTDRRIQARFLTVGEGRADLDSRRSGLERFL